MFKKSFAIILACLLVQMLSVQPATAKSKEEKKAELTQKVKTGISKLGVGRDARVEVRLRDRTKLAGYISEVKDESFIITDSKTSATTTVAYGDVTQVKGHNLSTGAKIAIGVGIGVAIVVIILAIWWSNQDHGIFGN
jgi:hypothetical protein